MSRNRVVLPTRDGLPNNIEYSVENGSVVCISDEPLDIIDQRAIEGLLNLDMSLGCRHAMEERRMDGGKWFSTWGFTESPDCDWS